MKTKQEIEELIEMAKRLNLEGIEVDGIKFSLSPNAKKVASFVEEEKAEDLMKPLSAFDELTEEEIQYWSSPYYDELQAKKEAAKNQKQIDDELRQAI